MMDDWDTGWWIAMMTLMVLFWVLLIAAVVWIARALTDSRERRDPK